MRHVSEHASALATSVQPRCAEVERLDEAQPVARTLPLQLSQVVQRARRIHHQGQHTGVWRDDQVFQRRAAQGQLRHAKGAILKRELVVLLEEGAFRNPPGNTQVRTIELLGAHR